MAVTATENADPAVAKAGVELSESWVAGPGFTVTEAVFWAAPPLIVAPMTALPAIVPVKLAV